MLTVVVKSKLVHKRVDKLTLQTISIQSRMLLTFSLNADNRMNQFGIQYIYT
jgi:hypothetical protein